MCRTKSKAARKPTVPSMRKKPQQIQAMQPKKNEVCMKPDISERA